MNLIKPNFWRSKKNLITIFLLPFSFFTKIIVKLKKKITTAKKFKIPIICVGNIFVGGTGKTPTSIYIANSLKKLGKKPVIIKKFYKNQKDEQDLIRKYFDNLLTDKSRINGILKAERHNYDIAILDDGFQDYKINKDFNLICFNQNQLIGNGHVFPAGPLRESLDSIKDSEVVLINGVKDHSFEEKLLNINKNLKIFYSNYKISNAQKINNKNLFALAGIGNPENFFYLLKKYKFNVVKKFIFPDHYQFTKHDLIEIIKESKKNNCQVVATEKDYYRIKDFNLSEIEYIKIDLEINNYKELIKEILDLYD